MNAALCFNKLCSRLCGQSGKSDTVSRTPGAYIQKRGVWRQASDQVGEVSSGADVCSEEWLFGWEAGRSVCGWKSCLHPQVPSSPSCKGLCCGQSPLCPLTADWVCRPGAPTGTDWLEPPPSPTQPILDAAPSPGPPCQALAALAPDVALYQVVFLRPGQRSIDSPPVELASNDPV